MCWRTSVEYAKVREQFGQPIGSFQAIRHRCAEMLLEVENAHAATYYAAWAVDDRGQFLYPTVPVDSFYREMAFRSGINILMYTLTGNYKADQVHVPALLERLGQ